MNTEGCSNYHDLKLTIKPKIRLENNESILL